MKRVYDMVMRSNLGFVQDSWTTEVNLFKMNIWHWQIIKVVLQVITSLTNSLHNRRLNIYTAVHAKLIERNISFQYER